MEKSIKYSFFTATYYFEHLTKELAIELNDQSAIFYRIKLKLFLCKVLNVAHHKPFTIAAFREALMDVLIQ